MTRLVPAWQVQTGSYTTPDWVHIFIDELGPDGWPKIKTVHYLTPVDPEEQKRLAAIKPEWMNATS